MGGQPYRARRRTFFRRLTALYEEPGRAYHTLRHVLSCLAELDKVIPLNDNYRHMEGNAAAHIKASMLGASETVFIENGVLVLGTWQSIFFCEFDGPRTRRVLVQLIRSE